MRLFSYLNSLAAQALYLVCMLNVSTSRYLPPLTGSVSRLILSRYLPSPTTKPVCHRVSGLIVLCCLSSLTAKPVCRRVSGMLFLPLASSIYKQSNSVGLDSENHPTNFLELNSLPAIFSVKFFNNRNLTIPKNH